MKILAWISANWKSLAKWGGLGFGCLAVLVGGFVTARYVAAGETYDGDLKDLAPNDVSVVVTVDNVPVRKVEFERFLDELTMSPRLPQLESSSLWKDNVGDMLGGSLENFRTEKYEQGLAEAKSNSNELGAELFRDILGGELVICTDPAVDEGAGGEFVMLNRVSRDVRFRWQFLDIASMFFPEGPNRPTLEYGDGRLKVTPPPSGRPDAPPPATVMITILGDVLVVSNSDRLFNGAIANYAGGGKRGISTFEPYRRTVELVDPELKERHVSGVWVNLDRMRSRLPAAENESGEAVSPVDTFNSLPNSIVGIYPDIFAPVNRILTMNLDARPFNAAYYGLDVSTPGTVMFDQYLLVDDDRVAHDHYTYLRKTWSHPAAKETQLELLPPDTMMQASYRQPIEVLYHEVFDESARTSLVGDFVVALNGPSVKAELNGDPEELVFAALPRKYAPDASIPLSGTDLPLPGFALAFRTPGATPNAARALLQEYLQAQRGRATRPGEEPAERKDGPVQVIRKDVAGNVAFGFHDPREEDNFIRRLNRSIRSALVGEWLVLTNSQGMLKHAFDADAGRAQGLIDAPGSPFHDLPGHGNASIYLNFEEFAGYATSRELFKVLRDNKYNESLIDGRDPGQVRREITRDFGYDPEVTENLTRPEVNAEYKRRKEAWIQTCKIEGDRYIASLRADMDGLRFFRDLALITTFEPDHLHVRGMLRTR